MIWEIFDLINIFILIWKLALLWALRIKSFNFCQKTAWPQPSSFEFQSWLCEIKVLTAFSEPGLAVFPKRHLDLNLRLSRFLSPDSPGLEVSTFSSYSAIVVSVRHKPLILKMPFIYNCNRCGGTDFACKRIASEFDWGGKLLPLLVIVTDATRVSGGNCKHPQRWTNIDAMIHWTTSWSWSGGNYKHSEVNIEQTHSDPEMQWYIGIWW